MSSNLKQTMINLFDCRKIRILPFLFFFITSCAFFNNAPELRNEREIMFEQAKTLMEANQYSKEIGRAHV